MANTPTSVPIGAVVKATGVGEATLRAWERRFGFPDPEREPSGHRRYSEADIDRVRAVLRLRDDGLTLRQAIAQVVARERPAATSVYAHLREARPDLAAQAIRSRHMARLSRAVEDELGALAEPGLLLGAFQREGAYRRSEARWTDLVRGGKQSFVLADFERLRTFADRPSEVPATGSGPMAAEWALVCVAAGTRACLIGRERPGQGGAAEDRLFDAFLSLEPDVVGTAAQAAIDLAAPHAPEVAAAAQRRLDDSLDPEPAAQLRLSGAITSRFVAAFG
jgi:MerR family transcriptional regulator, light-induced transcriptional regulator